MRQKFLFYTLAFSALTLATGCKIVKNVDPNDASEIEAALTDQERMAIYAREIWDSDVLPTVTSHLVPLAELRAALATDVEAAGKAHGLRPEGEANPWNFAVSGSGVVIEAKTKSRAAKLQVDTDADGKADVTLQLGPIVRGTTLRDAMPFLLFSNFRDQIEFAKLGGGLNAMAHERLTIPDADITGQTVSFEGMFTFKNLTSKFEVVPTALTYGE
jgi:predicted lipoprotein